jgi:hypothetical protein
MSVVNKIILLAIYLVAWIYVVPKMGDDYQFFAKVFLISLPILLGISEMEEVQEGYKDSTGSARLGPAEKKKVLAQLVNVTDQSSIALVYSDGTLNFLTDKPSLKNEKDSLKNEKDTTKNKKNKKEPTKAKNKNTRKKNWFNSL